MPAHSELNSSKLFTDRIYLNSDDLLGLTFALNTLLSTFMCTVDYLIDEFFLGFYLKLGFFTRTHYFLHLAKRFWTVYS